MSRENEEDVSFDYVPGSTGSSGSLVTPWTARRSAEIDRVRAIEMAKIKAMLTRPAAKRAVRLVNPQDYQKAIESFQRETRPVGSQA